MPFFIEAHIAAGCVGDDFIFFKAIAHIIIIGFDGDPNAFADIMWNFGTIGRQA
jgi:hypothetical protein